MTLLWGTGLIVGPVPNILGGFVSKPKLVNFKLIPRGDKPEYYTLLDEIVQKYHGDLVGAVFVIFDRKGWKPNPDNMVVLAQIKIATDLQKTLQEHDLQLMLNSEWWDALSRDDQIVILDSELDRVAPAKDKHGDQREDEYGRMLWRLRKYEFNDAALIKQRHGKTRTDVLNDVASKIGGSAEDGSYASNVLTGKVSNAS